MGEGIVRALAAHGAVVAVNDLHADRAAQVAYSVRDAVAAPFDVTDGEAVADGVAAAGPFDILVNNAGVPQGMGVGPFADMDPGEWARYIDLNLYGVLQCSHAVLGPMRERGWGRIVTISSGAGATGISLGVSLYGAGKGGAIAFMRHLAIENAKEGITIANTLALGLMDNRLGSDVTAHLARSVPVGRLGRREDVGAAVAYLASEEAAWLTAQTINLDGGSLPS